MYSDDLEKLWKECWSLMSEYIRRRDRRCFTCGKIPKETETLNGNTIEGWKKLHAGHYKHSRLDFDKKNIHAQCRQCNYYKHGNLDIYTQKFIKKYGMEELEALEKRARDRGNRYTFEELQEIKVELQKDIRELILKERDNYGYFI